MKMIKEKNRKVSKTTKIWVIVLLLSWENKNPQDQKGLLKKQIFLNIIKYIQQLNTSKK